MKIILKGPYLKKITYSQVTGSVVVGN